MKEKKVPVIGKENVKTLCDARFVKLYDLQYADGCHYFEASRNRKEDLAAVKSDGEFKKMLPDAVTCFVIVKNRCDEPKLLLSYEYRYPAGRFLLSPTAGLIDQSDRETDNPLVTAAKREIFEETGIVLKDTDRIFEVSRLVFSTPGMTDESNGFVCAVAETDGLSCLTQKNVCGTELFDGFELVDRKEAAEILRRGTDRNGNFFSVYTWAALMYFASGMWESDE